MNQLPFERILCLQHGLKRSTGHWLRETLEWRNAAQALGLQWVGLAHHSLDKAIASEHGLQAVFPLAPYDRVQVNPRVARIATLIEHSTLFARSAHRFFPTDISARDLIFIPFSADVELYGIAKWLDTIAPDKRPMVAFMFHQYDLSWQMNLQTRVLNGDVSTWEYAARALLQRLPAQRIRLLGSGQMLCDILSAIFLQPVYVSLLVSPVPTQTLPSPADKPYDLGILGGGRDEQGAGSWEEILTALARLRPAMRIALQVSTDEQAEKLRTALGGLLPASQLDIHVGALMGEAFYERMLKCKLLLLNYENERYFVRDSGVFIEAANRAIPTIVPANTTMARHIESGQAAGIVFGQVQQAPAAIHAALDDYEALSQKAHAYASQWQHAHDATTILRAIGQHFSA